MTYLGNLLRIIGLLAGFSAKIKFQKNYLQKTLGSVIEQSRTTNVGSLDEDDFRKIYLYGYAIPAMLGETFCVLTGQKMSLKERLTMTSLASITGLFDDFFDKKKKSENQIKSLMDNPKENVLNDSYEKLIVNLFNSALENCSDKDELKQCCNNVFEAQVLSKKQLLPDIKPNEIREITLHKGGVSMLLYSCALSESLNETDKKIIFKLGGIGQLENDIFDVYKDYQEGIKTLVTIETKINNLRKTYSDLIADVFRLVKDSDHPLKNQQQFLRILALILSRGYVCLDSLEKNEKSTNGLFAISAYSKKDLTCDIEKPASFFKLLHYAAKMNY